MNPESRNRLPVVKRDALGDVGRKLFEDLVGDARRVTGFQGPTGIRLHSPDAAGPHRELMTYLRFESALPGRDVELAVLTVARELDAQFVWQAHESVALRDGVLPMVIDVVKHRRPLEGLADRDAAIIALGREAIGQRKVSSQTYARALRLFGAKGLVDLSVLFSEYAATAVLLDIFDQQLPPGAAPPLPAIRR